MEDLVKQIKGAVDGLPALLASLEPLADEIIANRSTDAQAIEHLLDSIASFLPHGLGSTLYLRLLEHYKSVDAEGAVFYWELYEQMDS